MSGLFGKRRFLQPTTAGATCRPIAYLGCQLGIRHYVVHRCHDKSVDIIIKEKASVVL